jgi:hypothetical protein
MNVQNFVYIYIYEEFTKLINVKKFLTFQVLNN